MGQTHINFLLFWGSGRLINAQKEILDPSKKITDGNWYDMICSGFLGHIQTINPYLISKVAL